MKTVILCGGLGTRISEETHLKPKPMIDIGDHPLLWHIMNIYHRHGFNDFVLALGYKAEVIKDFFLHYYTRRSDFHIDLETGEISYIRHGKMKWKVSLIDTGLNSMTGGRLYRLAEYLKDEKTFMLTYGDGLANVPVDQLLKFHHRHGKIATVTAVRPPARFGAMQILEDRVEDFHEKPQIGEGWINGGFFVFNAEIFNYLKDENTILEREPLNQLAKDGQLIAYQHTGFWQCMDTLRDKTYLDQLWHSGVVPWESCNEPA